MHRPEYKTDDIIWFHNREFEEDGGGEDDYPSGPVRVTEPMTPYDHVNVVRLSSPDEADPWRHSFSANRQELTPMGGP